MLLLLRSSIITTLLGSHIADYEVYGPNQNCHAKQEVVSRICINIYKIYSYKYHIQYLFIYVSQMCIWTAKEVCIESNCFGGDWLAISDWAEPIYKIDFNTVEKTHFKSPLHRTSFPCIRLSFMIYFVLLCWLQQVSILLKETQGFEF